jgi:hypothetical protein
MLTEANLTKDSRGILQPLKKGYNKIHQSKSRSRFYQPLEFNIHESILTFDDMACSQED